MQIYDNIPTTTKPSPNQRLLTVITMDKEVFTQSSIRSIAWVKLIQSAMLDQDFINIQINTNFQTSMDTNIQKSIHDKKKLLCLLYQKMKMFIMQVRKYLPSNV